MSEWRRSTVRELVDRHWSGEWGGEPSDVGSLARVYRSTEIDDDCHLDVEGGVYRSIGRAFDSKRIRSGDVLVEASGGAPGRPVGRIAFAQFYDDERRFASNFVRTLRPKTSVCGKYLAWKLHWLNKQPAIWRHQQQTTGIINLKIESYLDQPIDVTFDSAEQTSIVSVLDLADIAIEGTKALISKQERVRAGLLQDLFTRGVDELGQLRPPREEAPHLYQRTEIDWLPRGWEVTPLKAKAPSAGGHLKTGPFGSSLKIEHWVPQGRPVITIGSLGDGALDHNELLYVSEATAKRLDAYKLLPGDVVFSRVADVGRSVVIKAENSNWIMSSNLMRIRLDWKRCSPEYLYLKLAFDQNLRRQIRRSINAGGRDLANAAVLNSLKFSWPPAEEQERICGLARICSEKIERLREEAAKLALQKAGLMQDLLTGKVSVAPLLEGATA